MCLPPMIIAAAAMAAGAGMKAIGQSKADHAMTSTFNTEHARQQQYQAKEQQDFQDSLDSTKNTVLDPNAQAAATAKREANFTAATAPTSAAGAYLPGSSSAPTVVNAGNVAAGAKADARTASLGHSLASLGGMTDLMEQNDINIGHNRQDVAQQANFGNGSMNVLQTEMNAAKQKGSGWKMLGGLAQSIGQMMAAGGAGGGGGLGASPISGDLMSTPSLVGTPDWGAILNGMPGMAG